MARGAVAKGVKSLATAPPQTVLFDHSRLATKFQGLSRFKSPVQNLFGFGRFLTTLRLKLEVARGDFYGTNDI